MCGILGFINCGNEELLSELSNLMNHRGPDDTGLVWFDKFRSGFAHKRLSIIDLTSAGHQPMTNDKKNLWITYNGEIYNYKIIRTELVGKGYVFYSNSDTEVILKAYEEWGIECLNKFNGMYSFAIYNSENNSLFAARDRIGIKPFYYSFFNNQLIVSSEIKPIVFSKLIEVSPDYFSLSTPARYQIEPYTGFKNIFKLPQGHYLFYQNNKLEIINYWDLQINDKHSVDIKRIAEELDNILNDSVNLQMIADVPVGVLLSGGLDSSLISAMMRKNTNKDIYSFTIKISEEDKKIEKITDDSYYAKIMSDKFGFIHHEIEIDYNSDMEKLLELMVWHLEEPVTDSASINTYLISKIARENNIIVLLNGMGGDEIFGGYRKHLGCLMAEQYQNYFPTIFKKNFSNIVSKLPYSKNGESYKYIRWIKRFLSFANLPKYERYLVSEPTISDMQYSQLFNTGIRYKENYFFGKQIKTFKNDNCYLTNMCWNDTKVFLPELNCLYTDKSTMAASVEGRPPLTDHRIVEFMFNLPPYARIHKRTQKYLLKIVAERYLPKEIVYRQKSPFTAPIRAWLTGQLYSSLKELIYSKVFDDLNLYNRNYAISLLEEHKTGKNDNSLVLWTILTNLVWYKKFFTDL